MMFSGKFGDFVEKSHAKIYATQTKGWMALPELKGVTTTLEKVHIELKITFFTFSDHTKEHTFEQGGVVLDLGCGSASSRLVRGNLKSKISS